MNSEREIIIDDSEIGNVFESIYNTIMTEIQKHQAGGLGWTIDSMIEQSNNISKYKILNGSSQKS